MENTNNLAVEQGKTEEVIVRTLAFSTRRLDQSPTELRDEYEAGARKLMSRCWHRYLKNSATKEHTRMRIRMPTHLRAALLGISLSSALIAVCPPAAAAPQPEPASRSELDRAFAFMTKKWGSTMEELREEYEAFAPTFVADTKGIVRRYSRNYIVRVLGPGQPDFHSITEFAHIPGGEGAINASRPEPEDSRDIARITTLHFTQRLVAGPPLVHEPGRVHKRGIFLRRATQASSPEIVAAELSGFVENLAKQLQSSTNRVMLYVGTSPRRNYQSVYYPANTELDRYMDAIVMLWPKEGSALPETFDSPANFAVLTVIDFEAHDSKIDF